MATRMLFRLDGWCGAGACMFVHSRSHFYRPRQRSFPRIMGVDLIKMIFPSLAVLSFSKSYAIHVLVLFFFLCTRSILVDDPSSDNLFDLGLLLLQPLCLLDLSHITAVYGHLGNGHSAAPPHAQPQALPDGPVSGSNPYEDCDADNRYKDIDD